jgi:MYXO-CTERM domain-containing protein
MPWGFGSNFVLTRLHARYGEDSLGADLVFEEAPPMEGGRERRKDGKLEQGPKQGKQNNFQARYAIRHEWQGAIACDKPRRGIWGGPPKGDAGVTPQPRPRAARNLAFAKRGGVKLSSFVQGGIPRVQRSVPRADAPQPATAAATPLPAPDSPVKPSSDGGCSCVTAGGPDRRPTLAWWCAAGLALAIGRRRRK